jgi:hypothetical protein
VGNYISGFEGSQAVPVLSSGGAMNVIGINFYGVERAAL